MGGDFGLGETALYLVRLPLAYVALPRIHDPPEFAVHFKPITDYRVAIQSGENRCLPVAPQDHSLGAVSDVVHILGHLTEHSHQTTFVGPG